MASGQCCCRHSILSGLLVAYLIVACHSLTISSYLNDEDMGRFRNLVDTPYGNNLEELKYTVMGLNLLGVPLANQQKMCETVLKNVDASDLKSLYYGLKIVNLLKSAGKPCELPVSEAASIFTAAMANDATMTNLLYAIDGLSLLGQKVESSKAASALEAALKADDSPLSYAQLFYAASKLSDSKTMKKFHDLIEDIIAQADEIDEKYLQFDSGLSSTAAVVFSAYKLSSAAGVAPPIAEDKVVKLTNYLINRKHAQKRSEVVMLLAAINELANNKFHSPVSVSLAQSLPVSAENSLVQVRVCNLLGKSLGKLSVTAETARHEGDDAVILSKKAFSAVSNEGLLYNLDLMKVNPKPGFYRLVLAISASQSQIKLLGATNAEIEIKVTTNAVVDNVELSVADKDQSSIPKSIKLQYPGRTSVEADYHQRLVLKFVVRDEKTKQAMNAHQTFVRLTNLKTKQEVIFVAETENENSLYKFDLDVGAKAKDFLNLSGKYSMDLIVGDPVINKAISWQMADVQLTFQDEPQPSISMMQEFSKKPEIKHVFRLPEKRPSLGVSNCFTVLVLLPILILFALWIKLGANISNFPLSLSALGFHAGVIAIFALYGCYFLHLTMFEALRYLGLIGMPTFLFGHRLLSSIAAARGSKSRKD